MSTGADTDIVVASARAYVAAINRMIAFMRSNADKVPTLNPKPLT
jgi:2-isopropylmalate synthase